MPFLKFLFRIFIYLESIFYSLVIYLQLKLFSVHFLSLPKISGVIYLLSTGKMIIGKNVTITSSRRGNPIGGECRTTIVVLSKAVLTIGNNCGLSNCTIYCACEIKIEDNVFIGGGVKIYDTDFHSIDPIARINLKDSNIKKAPIRLGLNSFIGAYSIILKGVTIGENAVIGAGSVVTRDIPPNEIWAGNPAIYCGLVSGKNGKWSTGIRK